MYLSFFYYIYIYILSLILYNVQSKYKYIEFIIGCK
nr:MAG TPA: hypothetical protein [Caudoviricetes sp.]